MGQYQYWALRMLCMGLKVVGTLAPVVAVAAVIWLQSAAADIARINAQTSAELSGTLNAINANLQALGMPTLTPNTPPAPAQPQPTDGVISLGQMLVIMAAFVGGLISGIVLWAAAQFFEAVMTIAESTYQLANTPRQARR